MDFFAPTYKFQPKISDVLSFYVIGCGGTGSKLVPELCQAIKTFTTTKDYPRITLTLCDHDVVEEKNLVRQNFISPDLGKNKALTLANRYSRGFGLPINAYVEIIDSVDIIDKLIINHYTTIPIIITCVDNHQTRKIIHNYISNCQYGNCLYWIDLANEETAGHVVIGYNTGSGHSFVDVRYSKMELNLPLPFVTEVYPEILEIAGEIKPSELPCGAGGVQDLNVNAAAAMHCMSFIKSLLKYAISPRSARANGEYVSNWHRLEFGVKPPAVRLYTNTVDNLLAVNWMPHRTNFIDMAKQYQKSLEQDKQEAVEATTPTISTDVSNTCSVYAST